MLSAGDPKQPLVGAPPLSTAVMWACVALFFARVVGQIEVLLVSPSWLPEMPAWYSGLLPYPLLLPIQIALLMLMCVLALRSGVSERNAGRRAARRGKMLRTLALLYFAIMLARLILVLHLYGAGYYLHGAIPIAFHWVLALFVLVWARLHIHPRRR
jgi:hypothetical protein